MKAARLVWLVLVGMVVFTTACDKKAEIIPPKAGGGNEPADWLSYSSVMVLGADNIPWTGRSGILVFAVARNHAQAVWRGRPVAAAYMVNSDRSVGELIGTGEGVLTTFVNRENFTPTDEQGFIPGDSELESLTFIPVDFREHPRVYVYWRFVESGQQNFTFKRQAEVWHTAPLMSLQEARRLLQEGP